MMAGMMIEMVLMIIIMRMAGMMILVWILMMIIVSLRRRSLLSGLEWTRCTAVIYARCRSWEIC